MKVTDEYLRPGAIIHPDLMTDESWKSYADEVVCRMLGGDIRLETVETFRTGKSLSGRFRVNGSSELGSLFIKHIPEDKLSDRILDGFKNEVTAYRVFKEIPEVARMTPAVLGTDLDSRVLLLEDLGSPVGPNTSDLFEGSDREAAVAGLVEVVTLLARFHGASTPLARGFKEIRADFGEPIFQAELFHDPWSHARLSSTSDSEVKAAEEQYRDICVEVGVEPIFGIGDEIAEITQRVEQDPGDWLAICKGDQNIAGDFIRTARGPMLFDFDAAGARHLMLEGMPARMTWGCTKRIPDELIPILDDAYRLELAKHLPIAAEIHKFKEAMADAAARWHVFHVIWRLSEALTVERPRGPSSLRQQTMAWLRAFDSISQETSRYPRLGLSARLLIERLTAIWPADNTILPWYPAFDHRSGSERTN